MASAVALQTEQLTFSARAFNENHALALVFEVQFTSVMRGPHIYKSVWTPTLGGKLNCHEDDRKEAKQHDEYAIWMYLGANTSSELVGHVPMEPSYLIYTFLRAYDDNEVSVEVTGSRRLENGLVVSGTFKVQTPSKAISIKFEREILYPKELCAHMDISIKTLRKIPMLSKNFQTMKLEIVSH